MMRYPKLYIYISEPISDIYEYIPVAKVDNALHDLTLIKMSVARFVGTGSFLNMYSKGRTK